MLMVTLATRRRWLWKSSNALEKFKHLNETHHPEPLPDDVLAELDRILAAAEREVGMEIRDA